MKKKLPLFQVALLCLSLSANAQQKCATDEMYAVYKQRHPEITQYEEQLKTEIRNTLSRMSPAMLGRTTAGEGITYDVPVVVHVMHNYGAERVPDNDIYAMIAHMNRVYNLQNDTSSVIQPFKKHVGKANIRFHLATKDPLGQPTKGITHKATYLTYGGDDQAKMDLWAPASYYNIWLENVIGVSTPGGIVQAYANFPSSAAAYPFNDGVISGYQFISGSDMVIEHETGHYLNLLHVWNSSGAGCGDACGDDDVDDTPPTMGHQSNCPLYDSACSLNYFKIYTSSLGTDSLVDYPDTANVQNIMDYSSCTVMFTKLQGARMRATLNTTIGGRASLVTADNLTNTGALEPTPDLQPITDYCVKGTGAGAANFANFTCPGTVIKFFNHSWNDTITNMKWDFTNGASNPSMSFSTSGTVNTSVSNAFTEPGWMSLTMGATGNNSGTTTTTYPRAVFVANTTATPGVGYYQEFAEADTAQWPIFNYYNNEFNWERVHLGYDDGFCMKYNGFDSRMNIGMGMLPPTGMPKGDYDDMFSVPIDLTGFSGACFLNFYYSGTSRSSNSADINDVFEISYSTDHAQTWKKLDSMTKGSLANMGASATAWVPTSMSDWAPKAISIPDEARTNYTVFRFRYKPNVGNSVGIWGSSRFYPLSSGNNFYLDRINFNSVPAGVNTLGLNNASVIVAPNPTSGDAYVVIHNAGHSTASIAVTDITGKVVYTTSQQLTGGDQSVAIPHAAISTPGIYIVRTTTGQLESTLKLVVQ